MRKARPLGHEEAELLGPSNLDGNLFPPISPFCGVARAMKQVLGAVQEACVECSVLSFLSQNLSLSPFSFV